MLMVSCNCPSLRGRRGRVWCLVVVLFQERNKIVLEIWGFLPVWVGVAKKKENPMCGFSKKKKKKKKKKKEKKKSKRTNSLLIIFSLSQLKRKKKEKKMKNQMVGGKVKTEYDPLSRFFWNYLTKTVNIFFFFNELFFFLFNKERYCCFQPKCLRIFCADFFFSPPSFFRPL